MAGEHDLTPPQWRSIAHLPRGKLGDRGRNGSDERVFINGVLWIMCYDRQWRDLPARFGPWKTAHQRFIRWRANGVWDEIFEVLTTSKNNKKFLGELEVDAGIDYIGKYRELCRPKRVGKKLIRFHGTGRKNGRVIRGAKRPRRPRVP